MKLWNDFNTCWLAVLQKQKDTTQELIDSGNLEASLAMRRRYPEIIPYDFLEGMGKDLVKLCDDLEKHGLVDYEMGVWEEEIIASEFWSLGKAEGFITETLFSPHALYRTVGEGQWNV